MTTGQKVVLALLTLSLIAGLATGGKLYYRLSVFWALLFFGAWICRHFHCRLEIFAQLWTLPQVGQILKIQVQGKDDRLWLDRMDPPTSADGSH
jgi:hypothetical protein